jgi:hypothetical protein
MIIVVCIADIRVCKAVGNFDIGDIWYVFLKIHELEKVLQLWSLPIRIIVL